LPLWLQPLIHSCLVVHQGDKQSAWEANKDLTKLRELAAGVHLCSILFLQKIIVLRN
jgi:hypothetical protein